VLGNIGGIIEAWYIISKILIAYLCIDFINIKFIGYLKENLTKDEEDEANLDYLNEQIN